MKSYKLVIFNQAIYLQVLGFNYNDSFVVGNVDPSSCLIDVVQVIRPVNLLNKFTLRVKGY